MAPAAIKVGEVAARPGLSVRTLHFYEEIGLLAPARTEAGHRLYRAADVARLQQITSLRQLGFSLDKVKECLTRPDYSPLRVIAAHLARVRERIALEERLAQRLEMLAAALTSAHDLSPALFLQAIEMMRMVEQHFTPEQLAWLQERRAQLGEETIKAVEAEWPRLIAAARAAMNAGTDPTDPTVRALAERRRQLSEAFHGNNPEIQEASGKATASMVPEKAPDGGIDREMMAYIARAQAMPGSA